MNINVAQAKKVRAGLSCYKMKQFLPQTTVRPLLVKGATAGLEFREHPPFGHAREIAFHV
jgi:hypothetical protein